MKQVSIGNSELSAGSLAYGCWRLTDDDTTSGRDALIAAYEAGYTLFDNADIYGGGNAEVLFGRTVKEIAGMRDRIVILTKCGVRKGGDPTPESVHRYDGSGEFIVASCEGSLRRLGVECVDIFMLHRPDYLTDPQEVARAFTQLKEQGKARHFAVSNFRPTLIAALEAACPMPIVTHQFEFSLARLDPLSDGTLDQCLAREITPMAWSPLGGGLLADGAGRLLSWQQEYDPDRVKPILDEVAGVHGVSRAVVAMAWLMKHPAGVMPICGSTKPDRIQEAARAASLELSRDDWYRLFTAAAGKPLD
jgi:predicted oxidoreductase